MTRCPIAEASLVKTPAAQAASRGSPAVPVSDRVWGGSALRTNPVDVWHGADVRPLSFVMPWRGLPPGKIGFGILGNRAVPGAILNSQEEATHARSIRVVFPENTSPAERQIRRRARRAGPAGGGDVSPWRVPLEGDGRSGVGVAGPTLVAHRQAP